MLAFGLVSLSADMVYEGMRAVSGPFLGSLGAGALAVGLVTGAGEAVALVLRLVTGPAADRSGQHWRLTVVGYTMTAVCVPLLAVAPFVGSLGVGLASVLILLERTGKAVRSPSKSALLARMTVGIGRGRGFAAHKALDQVGAFAGPLLVAGFAAWTGRLWPGFLALAVPGVVCLVLLARLRPHVRAAGAAEPAPASARPGFAVQEVTRLPRSFYALSGATAAATAGLMTFGLIGFHAVDAGLLSAAGVPLVYAMAMAVEAVAALATGFAYDRVGAAVLYALPLLAALVPPLALAGALPAVVIGVLLWGLATGVADSTVKALVADLVPAERLATAYGSFAAFQGVAALGGGALAGALYADHLIVLVAVLALAQVAALVLLRVALRR